MDNHKTKFVVSYIGDTPFLKMQRELKLGNALPDQIAVLYVYQSNLRSVFLLDLCEWLIAYTDFLNQAVGKENHQHEVDLLISAGKFKGQKIKDIVKLTLWKKTKNKFEILEIEYAAALDLHGYLKDYYFNYVTEHFYGSPKVTGQERYQLTFV